MRAVRRGRTGRDTFGELPCTCIGTSLTRQPPRCVLCSRTAPPVHLKARGKKAIGEFDLLSALKPTEGNRWAHVLCSAWLPELVYTTPAALKLIEGISNLPRVRWEGACGLCGQLDGAKVECVECNTGFHASCAWLAGHKFGFEISLVSRNLESTWSVRMLMIRQRSGRGTRPKSSSSKTRLD